jgi:23S rRNA (adenine2503-C2)-methyltransferase
VPINEKTGLTEVLEAADAYFQKTGRQVTYEYVMLHEINDRPEHAEQLARLLTRRKAHVNVIPYNPVAGLPYERPDAAAVGRFLEILRGRGVSATARKTKGRSIDAACGQLRRRAEAETHSDSTGRSDENASPPARINGSRENRLTTP